MFQVTEVLLTNAKHWVMYQVTKMVGWLCSIGIGIAFRLIGVNDSCSEVVVVGKVQADGLA